MLCHKPELAQQSFIITHLVPTHVVQGTSSLDDVIVKLRFNTFVRFELSLLGLLGEGTSSSLSLRHTRPVSAVECSSPKLPPGGFVI